MVTDKRNLGRSIIAVLVAAMLVIGFIGGTADAKRRRKGNKTTTIVQGSLEKTVVAGQITAISGKIASNPTCIPNRTVDILWGPDTAQQNTFGGGTTDSGGEFNVTGSAPDGSFITIQVEEVTIGETHCKRGAFFGQL
jgi:hypothetical protein